MQAQLDLYAQGMGQRRDPAAARMVAVLREQADRMALLVRTLLDMSEMQTLPYSDPIVLMPLMEEVLTDLTPLAAEKHIRLAQAGFVACASAAMRVFSLCSPMMGFNMAVGAYMTAIRRP